MEIITTFFGCIMTNYVKIVKTKDEFKQVHMSFFHLIKKHLQQKSQSRTLVLELQILYWNIKCQKCLNKNHGEKLYKSMETNTCVIFSFKGKYLK